MILDARAFGKVRCRTRHKGSDRKLWIYCPHVISTCRTCTSLSATSSSAWRAGWRGGRWRRGWTWWGWTSGFRWARGFGRLRVTHGNKSVLSIQVSSALRKIILHSRREYSKLVGRTRRNLWVGIYILPQPGLLSATSRAGVRISWLNQYLSDLLSELPLLIFSQAAIDNILPKAWALSLLPWRSTIMILASEFTW